MSNITKFSLAGILLIVIVISNSIFVISEVERGVTLRFCLLYTSPSPRDV